ncbi:cellulose binding domain-containing protein [Glycomyces terrestris]|nr:cellulose binding domain-containing protein [Glycomyces terrestris]
MHRSEPEPAVGGRLHGRLLQVLGVVSGVVALVAMWQLGVFGGGGDREPVSAVDGATTEWPSAAAESSSAAAVAEPSSSAAASPSESVSASASPTPSDAATTAAPPAETETPVEEDDGPATEGFACVAYLEIDEAWDDSVSVTVEVVNSGDERLGSWEVDLDLDDADIYHHWNMVDRGHGRFGNEDWNGRLDPGEDAVTGFQAEVEHDFDLPGSVPCSAGE